ncbi:MAG TPA: PhoH family protein [Nitrososphaeraceae archaeon]|nr:PhoH family protein [Nitrososphaeraceae archaeon]
MSAQKRTPVKREPKKEKVVENTLTSSREVKDKVELKPHQKPVSNFLRQNDISIILSGAGCAKDFVQMYRAIEGLKNKEFERIVITKPIIELGASVGFLPGLEEKFENYLRSFYNTIDKIVGKESANAIKAKVQFEHIGFQRGNTFPEHSVIILSEVQNMTAHEAISYVSRLPESSKMFVNGDWAQSDLGAKSGLNIFLECMSGVNGVGIAILDPKIHQMRRKIINDIADNYLKILKRQGKFVDLDKSKFEFVEL